MAHTARAEDEKKEFFDPPEVLERKVEQLAQWIRESKHMITFTGAGISTGAGIPDFRSGMNTALSTGPGVWELRAQGALRDKRHRVTSIVKAIPTSTHMMFVKLQQEGILKCCVSQNVDGLHRRSGLPKAALCELHGNTNLEICTKCGREYLRDYQVRSAHGVHDHQTGRKCDNPSCRGPLKDTIINFGENLPEYELTKSFEEAEVADLCIAMGSSLTVTPAANIPERVGERRQRLVIVNLQRTPLDRLASLCINAKCEDVSKMLMTKLGLDIPEFRLQRRVIMQGSCKDKDMTSLSIEGRDIYGHPFSLLKSVSVTTYGQTHYLSEPFSFQFPWKPIEKPEIIVQVTLNFHAHYGEPPVTRDFHLFKEKDNKLSLLLIYNPFNGEWTITEEEISDISSQVSAMSLK